VIPRKLVCPLRATLPEADLDAATVLGEGWAQVAYRVPTADGDWVLRHPQLTKYDATKHPDLLAMAVADLEREARLLPALAEHGLPVPPGMRLLHDDGGQIAGTIHRPIDGEPVARAMLVGGTRTRLAAAFGAFFTRLHAFPRDRAVTLGLKDIDLWKDEYCGLVEFCRPLLAARSRAWLDVTVERFLAEGGTTGAPRVLIHGDIGPEHLLISPDREFAGSIDFGDAMVADPALDFAGLWLACRKPFMEQVLTHYGGEIDPGLRRRAGFYVEVVGLYQVRYGDLVEDGREHTSGKRRIAARAAAATRRGAR
jgi:aminoglycoside 2''-phosphotransferase